MKTLVCLSALAFLFASTPTPTQSDVVAVARNGRTPAIASPDAPKFQAPLFTSTEADTYIVAEFSFDAAGGGPDPQGGLRHRL